MLESVYCILNKHGVVATLPKATPDDAIDAAEQVYARQWLKLKRDGFALFKLSPADLPLKRLVVELPQDVADTLTDRADAAGMTDEHFASLALREAIQQSVI